MHCLIVGMGIAGPTLAYWLERAGHRVTLIERASGPREGGYVIDFWGAGFDVAERMGVLPAVRAKGYDVGEVRMVGPDGARVGGFSADVFGRMANGRYTSVARADLAAVLDRHLDGRANVERRFGVELEALEQHDDGVRATFVSEGKRQTETFDLVVGADGSHSQVRALVFGPETQFEKHLGYGVAAFRIAGYRPREERTYVMHTEVGRQMARFSMANDETMVLLVWTDDGSAWPTTDATARARVRERFAGMQWEAPHILAAMDDVNDLYVDRVSQIRMPEWHRGRVALIGDAAHAPSLLAGQGSALAMIGAYVLAVELGRAGAIDDALARYQAHLHAFVTAKQDAAEGFAGSFAPRSRWGLWLRNRMTSLLAVPWIADRAIGSSLRDTITLPDHATDARRSAPEEASADHV